MKLDTLFKSTRAQDEATERVSIVNMCDLESGMAIPRGKDSTYGATTEEHVTVPVCNASCNCSEDDDDEEEESHHRGHGHGHRNWMDADDRASFVSSVFSTVRSIEKEEEIEVTNESELYRNSSAFQRAMPERAFALTITLLLEIPVLMMVSGGSSALCELIGRSRYQLLIGFLPLTSAISGNVGLQASTLTTRAISHSHVTVKDYWIWLSTEVAAAIYLGLGMGAMLGSIAFAASGFDWAFGVTICVAQLLSIVTAGLTGTLAPLIFSFLFKRDSGKWGGPLETAIQDIVGSFAMVIVSYHILKFLGPGPIDPFDVCGPSG